MYTELSDRMKKTLGLSSKPNHGSLFQKMQNELHVA